MISCLPPTPCGNKLTGKRNRKEPGRWADVWCSTLPLVVKKRRPLQAGGLSTSLGLLFIAEESGFDGSSLSKMQSQGHIFRILKCSILEPSLYCVVKVPLPLRHNAYGHKKNIAIPGIKPYPLCFLSIRFFFKWLLIAILMFICLHIVGIKPRASHISGKHWTPELCLQP